MKQVAQDYKSGQLSLLDVPTPACKDGGILVSSLYSLISTGTPKCHCWPRLGSGPTRCVTCSTL